MSRRDVRALLTRGQAVIRNRDPLDRPADPHAARIGGWIDQNDWLHQEPLPHGRYDETRG